MADLGYSYEEKEEIHRSKVDVAMLRFDQVGFGFHFPGYFITPANETFFCCFKKTDSVVKKDTKQDRSVSILAVSHFRTSLLSILVYITWQLGAHDPVQFGWQVDVISVTIFVIIEMALYTYIVTLLINSHLAAVQNRLGVLESLRTTYITFGMTLALTLPAVSLILILETGQVRWSIFSTCSYGIACATTGFYISVVMIILGRYLDKMRRRAEKRGSYLRTALSPKAMRKLSCSVFSSNNNSKIPTSSNHTIYKSHRNEPAPPSPSPCGAHAAGAKGGGGLRTIMSGFWIGTLTGSSSSMVGPAAATATTTTTGNTMTTTGSSIKAAASGKNNGFDSSATLKANCFTSDQKTMTLHDSAPSLKEEKEISKSYKGEASKSVTVTVSSTAWDHHPLATQPSPTSNSNQGIRIKAAAAAIGTRKVYDMSRNTLPACRAGSSDSCVKNNNSSRGASAVRATTTSKKKSSSLTHIGDITSSATTTNEPDSKIDKAMAPTAMSMPSMVTGEHGRGGGAFNTSDCDSPRENHWKIRSTPVPTIVPRDSP
eukprot:jgi/Bigna1/77610/fgenesh1_pg.49_\